MASLLFILSSTTKCLSKVQGSPINILSISHQYLLTCSSKKKGLTIYDIGWTQLKKNQTLQQDQQATGLTFSCNYKIIFKLFYV